MRRITFAIAALGVLVLTACSTTTADYRDQTEDYLNEDGAVEELTGGDVTDAECEEPLDTEVGTRYSCRAQVEGSGTFTFEVEINGEDSYSVFDLEPGG